MVIDVSKPLDQVSSAHFQHHFRDSADSRGFAVVELLQGGMDFVEGNKSVVGCGCVCSDT